MKRLSIWLIVRLQKPQASVPHSLLNEKKREFFVLYFVLCVRDANVVEIKAVCPINKLNFRKHFEMCGKRNNITQDTMNTKIHAKMFILFLVICRNKFLLRNIQLFAQILQSFLIHDLIKPIFKQRFQWQQTIFLLILILIFIKLHFGGRLFHFFFCLFISLPSPRILLFRCKFHFICCASHFPPPLRTLWLYNENKFISLNIMHQK